MIEEKFAYYMNGRHFEDKHDTGGKSEKAFLEVDKLSVRFEYQLGFMKENLELPTAGIRTNRAVTGFFEC